MVKCTVKAFTFGRMVIDMRKIIQKSSAADWWFWSTHLLSGMTIICEQMKGEFKQGNADGQGMKYYVNGKKEAGTWENWIFLD